jgi:hypothetical protein
LGLQWRAFACHPSLTLRMTMENLFTTATKKGKGIALLTIDLPG